MGKKESLKIDTYIRTLSVTKLDKEANRNIPVTFRVNVKFDESQRKVDETTVEFGITINMEPKIAQFGLEGSAVIKGKTEDMNQAFTTPPDSKVPNILFEIYDKLFTAIYVTSTILDLPCPSPELLKTSSISEESKKI